MLSAFLETQGMLQGPRHCNKMNAPRFCQPICDRPDRKLEKDFAVKMNAAGVVSEPYSQRGDMSCLARAF